VLPAHFLRVIRRLIRRSFHVDHSLDHVDRSFGRPRSCGNRSLGHILARLARPLGHSFVHVGHSLGSARGSHSLDYFVGLFFRWLLVGSFHVGCLLVLGSFSVQYTRVSFCNACMDVQV
jgi:hypothetical protein